jgi:hypothetical protein
MAEGPRERSEVSVRGVLIGAGAIVAAVLLSLLAARALLDHFGRPPPAVAGNPFSRTAGPALEVRPDEDLLKFRAEEGEKLEQYRVIDAQSGVVQIPIERAMDLVAAEHSNATRTSQ